MPWIVFEFCEKCETIQKQFKKNCTNIVVTLNIIMGIYKPQYKFR